MTENQIDPVLINQLRDDAVRAASGLFLEEYIYEFFESEMDRKEALRFISQNKLETPDFEIRFRDGATADDILHDILLIAERIEPLAKEHYLLGLRNKDSPIFENNGLSGSLASELFLSKPLPVDYHWDWDMDKVTKFMKRNWSPKLKSILQEFNNPDFFYCGFKDVEQAFSEVCHEFAWICGMQLGGHTISLDGE